MNDSDRNEPMDPRDEKALILGGMITMIVTGLALSFFQTGSRETFDIWRLVQVFCIVSITTFTISFCLFRHILMRDIGRGSLARHYILSLLGYPLIQSPLVKGLIAVGLACAGIILYIFPFGQQPVSVFLCSLFGIPLVAFLNNTFGRRRNEMVMVTVYYTIIFLFFFIRAYGPSLIANNYSRPASWAWLMMVILILACFFLLFYPNLFSPADEERKDTLERKLVLNLPGKQAFDLCRETLEQVFLGRIVRSDSGKGSIDLQTPLSLFNIRVMKTDNGKTRITIHRVTSRYIQISGFMKRWHIWTLERICDSVRKLDPESLAERQ